MNLTRYTVTLKADPSFSWSILAKNAAQAKSKALHRIRTVGSSTLKLADLEAVCS